MSETDIIDIPKSVKDVPLINNVGQSKECRIIFKPADFQKNMKDFKLANKECPDGYLSFGEFNLFGINKHLCFKSNVNNVEVENEDEEDKENKYQFIHDAKLLAKIDNKTKKLTNIVIDKNGDNYINKPIIEIQNPDLDGYERIDDYLNIIIDDNNSIAHINCKELINKMSDKTYNTQPKTKCY